MTFRDDCLRRYCWPYATIIAPKQEILYDDTVPSGPILAAADLYHIYMHERLGVFRVMDKLQEQFQAGTLRISAGPGAIGLLSLR